MKANELKAELVRQDKTQKDLAEILGKTEATVCRNINSGYMTLEDAKIISNFLNLSLVRRAEIFLE